MMEQAKLDRRVVELRAAPGGEEKMTVVGYAIIFDQPATQRHGSYSFTEVIRAGALDNTDMRDVPMRYNHNDGTLIMARTRNHSLRLTVDEQGLKIEADLLDTQSNRDLYKAIKEGLVDKMSFAFSVSDKGDTWTYGENGSSREVNAIERLFDVSVVDTPFYDSTSISARCRDSLESEARRLDSQRMEMECLKLKIQMKMKG